MLLCLDTSHGASVALLRGYTLLGSAANDNPRQHTEALSPMINEVLAQAGATPSDLDGIAVGTGPAPFTGLRVGLVTARTFGLALNIPVYGISALAAVARGVFDSEDLPAVTVVTDARRKEVYWARYARRGEHDVEETSPPAVARPADIAEEVREEAVRGRGVELYPEHFHGAAVDLDPAALGRIARARLEQAARDGTAVDLPAEPLYLRRPDIHPGVEGTRAS